jgi:hypothetical protein
VEGVPETVIPDTAETVGVTVVILVVLPFTSMVITGIAVLPPVVPAVATVARETPIVPPAPEPKTSPVIVIVGRFAEVGVGGVVATDVTRPFASMVTLGMAFPLP